MKNLLFLFVAACFGTAAILMLSSCNKDEDKKSPNEVLYGPTENPFGKSVELWSQEYYGRIMLMNCDSVLVPQVISLDNNVSAFHFITQDLASDITISKNNALFISLSSIIYDYPCPDTTFEPASGQSLEDFLKVSAKENMDGLVNLQTTYDGDTLQNLSDYRISTGLFNFTGNPTLSGCWDPCITGQSQPGVIDGYIVLFKKMPVGIHTITMHGEWPSFQYIYDVTLNVTVN
jgi:hypothetical protein